MSKSVIDRLNGAAATVRRRCSIEPKVALVLGSGLGAFADTFQKEIVVPYGEIEGMPVSHVIGHAGNLVFGYVGRVPVVAMQGRVHLYEGHNPNDVVFGTRLMLRLGASIVMITNAAGGLDAAFQAGDLMVLDDHLNLTGQNSLVGPNIDELGPRFPDMTTAYCVELRKLAHEVAKGAGIQLKRGVYAGLLGPTYETPAEVRMLRALGASAVGMSTVLETIAARHMGARVLGISCITNLAAGLSPVELSHDEVKETAERVRGDFMALLRGIVEAQA